LWMRDGQRCDLSQSVTTHALQRGYRYMQRTTYYP